MTTEHISSGVRASRPQQVDYNRRIESSNVLVGSPRAAGETPALQTCLRHRAVIRARRRRRGFGGAVVTDFTRYEIALNTSPTTEI